MRGSNKRAALWMDGAVIGGLAAQPASCSADCVPCVNFTPATWRQAALA